MIQALRQALAEPDKTVLLFEDEAGFYRQPTPASLYSKAGRGQPAMPLAHAANTRAAALGALDAQSGYLHFALASKARLPALLTFFGQVLAAYAHKERIYLVMDNWPVHKHASLEAFYRSEPRLKVLFLPTYAPWLNPIEKSWRRLRQNVSHAHQSSADFDAFKKALVSQVNSFNQQPSEMKTYAGIKTLANSD